MGVGVMGALDGNIKIPGAGEMPKKYVLLGVGAGTIAIIVIVIRKRKANEANAAAATAVTTAGTVTDPSGNVCTALDPNSGYCPGSPEDTAYQETATGSLGDEGYGQGSGDLGYGTGTSTAGLTYVTDPGGNQCTAVDPNTGYCPGFAPPATGTTGTGTVTTNSEWETEVLALLPGGASSANESALRGVLAGSTVTAAQLSIFNDALSLGLGPPPQGYPTPIKTSDTNGQPKGPAKAAGAISNLVEIARSPTSASIKWNAAPGATGGYKYVLSGPTPKTAVISGTSVAFHNLKPGKYTFAVQGLPGGPGNNIPITLS